MGYGPEPLLGGGLVVGLDGLDPIYWDFDPCSEHTAPPGGPYPMPQPTAANGLKGFTFLPITNQVGDLVNGPTLNCAETNHTNPSGAGCVGSELFFPAWPGIVDMAEPVYTFRGGGGGTDCMTGSSHIYAGPVQPENMNAQQPFSYEVAQQ